MKKTLVTLGLALFGASALALSARADVCSGQGVWCLFVDAGGCATTCGAGECCHVQGAYCAFGFGVDAVCTCRPCPTPKPPEPHGL